MKIAVLGAGISGLTAARLLHERGEQVTVFEKNSTAGGLARTRFKDGYLYDPHGGHIFNSKHKEVTDWVFSILPKDNWKYTVRNAKIFLNGRYISYPFELSLCELEPRLAVDCVYDLMKSCEGKEPDNFRDWLKWSFGKTIADTYMIPYNEKIWAYPLEDMETRWVQGKMPLPDKKEILRSFMLKDPTERKMPHSTFYYPLKGGIQTLMDAISKGLDIRLGTEINSIRKTDEKWYINGERGFDRVISTIPLPELPALMELPEKIVDLIRQLKYNSLTTVLFACEPTDITWLYIPFHEYRSHRVGYQSTLTPYACPKENGGCAALEVIGSQFTVTDDLAHRKDILPKELGFNKVLDSEFTRYAYVIHDKKYQSCRENILKYFEGDRTFRLLGRFGTWNYNNMDLCMLDAMELVKEI